jgi:hypothetical protein
MAEAELDEQRRTAEALTRDDTIIGDLLYLIRRYPTAVPDAL